MLLDINPGCDLRAVGLSSSILALTAVMLPPRSLHSNSPLDVSIKGQMMRDLLNLAGFVLPSMDSVASRPETRRGPTCRSAPFSVRKAGFSLGGFHLGAACSPANAVFCAVESLCLLVFQLWV